MRIPRRGVMFESPKVGAYNSTLSGKTIYSCANWLEIYYPCYINTNLYKIILIIMTPSWTKKKKNFETGSKIYLLVHLQEHEILWACFF